MPRLRAILIGCLATLWMLVQWQMLFEIAVSAGVVSTLLYDVPHSYRERRRLAKLVDGQQMNLVLGQHQLTAVNNQCNQLQHILKDRDERLQNTILELERRDAVGAPEARKLIDDQKETLTTQKKAMEEAQRLIRSQQRLLNKLESQTESGHGRWEDTLATLERMLANQAAHSNDNQQQMLEEMTDGNRELQRALTDLLQQLAMEPRSSSVNVQDSVVMGREINTPVDDAMRYRPSKSNRVSQTRTPPKPPAPELKAFRISQVGEPQRTTEEKWLKSLPDDLI